MLSRPEIAVALSLSAAHREAVPPADERHQAHWPVNEIMLQTLFRSGHSESEIAELYGVGGDSVVALRDRYGV